METMLKFRDAWAAFRGELEAERALSWRLYQGIEHTRQYVHTVPDEEPGGLLPNLPGWSHFEARQAFRRARGFMPLHESPSTPEPTESQP